MMHKRSLKMADDLTLGTILTHVRMLNARSGPLPLWEDEADARALAEYEEARAILIERNQAVAHQMAAKYRRDDIEHDDLVGEGMVGLCRAVDTWDPMRGKLWAWAQREVNKAISRSFDRYNTRPLKLPNEVARRRALALAFIASEEEAGRPRPSDEELAERFGGSPEGIRTALMMGGQGRSLYDLGTDGEGATDRNLFLLDEEAEEEIMRVERTLDAQRTLTELMGHLSPEQVAYVIHRHGLGGEEPQTRRQVAARLGLTESRAEELEGSAMEMLRGAASLL